MKIKNPKTIIFISNWFHTNYGGAAKNAQRLIDSLIKIGYKIIVISPSYGDKDEKNIDNQQGRLTVKRIKISPIFSQTFYHISVFSLLIRLRLQLKEKFIIQVFGLIQKGYVGAILFAKLFNQKIVGRITMLGSDDLLSIRKMSGKLRKLKYFICSKYDKIVCISSKIFSETKKELFNNQNAVYIPQSVDTDLFNSVSSNEKKKIRIKQNIKEDAFIILFCGMPVYRKGFDIILNIWPKILKNIPNAMLLVVGPNKHRSLNDDSFPRSELNDLLKQKESILFIGEVNNPEIYYNMSDIFLFPSRKEGFPNSLLEAMSSKLPSLIINASWVKGVKFFKHLDNIIISEENDLESIMSNLNELYCNLEFRNKISSNARRSVLKNHTLQNQIIKYDSLYSNLY